VVSSKLIDDSQTLNNAEGAVLLRRELSCNMSLYNRRINHLRNTGTESRLSYYSRMISPLPSIYLLTYNNDI
jgi:hypothetical protein